MSELNTAATNIYNRLAAAPTFHPAGADLFTDWNIQAGDVVTVTSDETDYTVPIYNMKLHWAGDSKIDVESTGNPEREPLPAIKRKEYASGVANYSAQKSLGAGVGNALQKTTEIDGVLYSAGIAVEDQGVIIYAGNDNFAASIVTMVNNSGSSVIISADHIDLRGYVTVSDLSAVEAQITNLTTGTTTAGSLRANNMYAGSMSVGGYWLHTSYITIDSVTYPIVTWGTGYY